MAARKKINGWVWVALAFAVCTAVYGVLSTYPRELAVYSDELRYLDIARSLWQGRGLRVRNMPSDYQKILYPLCIARCSRRMRWRAQQGRAAAARRFWWASRRCCPRWPPPLRL